MHRFVLNGFLKKEHLEDAIHEQNPNMTDEEKQDVAKVLDFVNEAEDTQAIVSGMVSFNDFD